MQIESIILLIKIVLGITIFLTITTFPAFYIAKSVNMKNFATISLVTSALIITLLSLIDTGYGCIAVVLLYPFNTVVFKTLKFRGLNNKFENFLSYFLILKGSVGRMLENSIKRNI